MNSTLCGALHPDNPTLACQEPLEPPHEWHRVFGLDCKEWRNEEYSLPPMAPRGAQRQTELMVDIARRATPVRHAPHPNSLRGYERIEPKRGTKAASVLSVLRQARGGWVPGHVLCTPEVGGSEGLRRLRELRDQGWPIDSREPPSGEGTDEYRLIEIS